MKHFHFSFIAACVCLLSLSFCEANHTNGRGKLLPASFASTRRGRRRPMSKGFLTEPIAKAAPPPPPPPPPEEKKTESKPIYSRPALYDLAFGYRNYEEEVDFLIGQHKALHDGKAPSRILEIAAGPARHSIHALKTSQVQTAMALDNSPEMVKYGMEIAAGELDTDGQPSFSYVEANMENFELPRESCDSAWILLGSLQHLNTNDKVIDCFKCVNQVLSPGGTLVIELPHPRETFSMVECTRNGWEVPLEDETGEKSGELQIIWGDDDDEFDPITQVRQFTVALELKDATSDGKELQSVREVVPMRLFTTQEIAAMAQIAGFNVSSLHGALANGVDINDEDQAFRLVCVLQKSQNAGP